MSFILDALRRAEAERQRGQVPGLHAEPPPVVRAAGAQSQRWPWSLAGLAGAALLVGGAALAWWALQPRPAPVPAPAAGPAASRPPAMAERTEPQPAPAATQIEAGADTPMVAAERPAAPLQPAPPPSLAPARPTVTTPMATASSAALRQPRPAAARASLPARPSPAVPAVVAAPASATEPGTSAAGDALRRAAGALRFGGAVQSQDRRQSFVLVGGQIAHEGDTLAPGIVLERIEARSVRLRSGQEVIDVGL